MRPCSFLVAIAVIASCSEDPGADTGSATSDPGTEEAGGGQPGCAEGEPEQVYRPDMVGCPGRETQCTAHELCAVGWHLCRFIDFEMRGGLDDAATEDRWLASCVREAGPDPLTCPDQAICASSCATAVSVNEVDVEYSCNEVATLTTALAPLGVAASADEAPHLSGCPGSVCAHARVKGTNEALGATCCLD